MSDGALDHSVIDTLRQLNQPGEPDVVEEVLGLFRDGGPARLASLGAAIERREAGALHRAAHDFKGASATIGAFGLQRCCRDLEEVAKAGTLDRAPELLALLQREYARVAAEIEELLRSRRWSV